MSAALLLIMVFSLSLYFIPALLSRRASYDSIRKFVVSSDGATAERFQNSSVAYAAQMSTFGPFFIWGLSGDTVGATINTAFFFLGLLMVWVFRVPMLAFLDERLLKDTSITPHAFIAAPYGDSRLIRTASSWITIIALLGIIIAEMMGVAAVLAPLLPHTPDAKYIVVALMFFMMVLYTLTGGNDGVMRSEVLQLRSAYCALAMFALVYLFSLSKPITSNPQIATLLAMISVASAVLFSGQVVSLGSLLKMTPDESTGGFEAKFQTFERAVAIITLLSLAAISLSSAYLFVFRDIAAFSSTSVINWFQNKSIPAIGLFSLAVLPLFYQVADITNWQRLAATTSQKDLAAKKLIGKHMIWFAIEASGFWFLLLLLGGLAASSIALTSTSIPSTFEDFVKGLVANQDPIHFFALSLLVVAVFAIALSTMDSVLSAVICAFRYDILELPKPMDSLATQSDHKTQQDIFRGAKFAVGFSIVAMAAIVVSERWLQFATDQFVAVLLAFYSAQLAFVPLIVGGLIKVPSKILPSEKFAFAALVIGAASGFFCSFYGIFSSDEFLSWAAIPASIVTGSVVYVIGVIRSTAASGDSIADGSVR
ncbi:MAG: hypothetical protein HW380_2972 [Magnetococcales bacterium]|nr:hypothetical protein [Magnetococcales bacterium]HIJ84805.1 hypothetical protein [Magnetococcales bacterium]